MSNNLKLVAVYGTLRQELYNHYLLRDAKFITKGHTEENCTMYSRGGFPVLSFHKGEEPAVVELYEVNPRTLEGLDALEGYRGNSKDSWYNRSLKVFFGDDGERYEALIYHQDAESDRPVVKGGDWVKARERVL